MKNRFFEYKSENIEKIEKSFIKNGFYIFDIANKNALKEIKEKFIKITCAYLKKKNHNLDLNNIHKEVNYKNINNFRLHVFRLINKETWLKPTYYSIFKEYLETLVGNELSMQNQINLSIQMPGDKSSVLPMHADSFNGESPFEVVAWLPLVNCIKTMSMFFIPPKISNNYVSKLNIFAQKNKGGMNSVANKIDAKKFLLKVKYGEGVIFSPNYLHGNLLNSTESTRVSFNTRFKSLLSPYTSKEKNLGNFYDPINIKAATIKGLYVKMPNKFEI
jgi:sporadic carbohydrate cluster 2OG-Fe(II) oxygenase